MAVKGTGSTKAANFVEVIAAIDALLLERERANGSTEAPIDWGRDGQAGNMVNGYLLKGATKPEVLSVFSEKVPVVGNDEHGEPLSATYLALVAGGKHAPAAGWLYDALHVKYPGLPSPISTTKEEREAQDARARAAGTGSPTGTPAPEPLPTREEFNVLVIRVSDLEALARAHGWFEGTPGGNAG